MPMPNQKMVKGIQAMGGKDCAVRIGVGEFGQEQLDDSRWCCQHGAGNDAGNCQGGYVRLENVRANRRVIVPDR